MRSLFVCSLALVCLLPLRSWAEEGHDGAEPPWGRVEGEPAAHVPEATEHEKHEPRWWLRSEYLLWWTKSDRTPPLVTQGEPTVARPGALGEFGTRQLVGGELYLQDRYGARFTFGVLLQDDWSAEASYFFLVSRTLDPTLSSRGSPVLARPFYNVALDQEDSSLVAFPNLLTGSVGVRADSFLHGAEANLLQTVWHGCDEDHCELLVGFRALSLNDNLEIVENATVFPDVPRFGGGQIRVSDRFRTENDFYGGQVGFRATYHVLHRLRFELLTKVALGVVHEQADIRGRTVIAGGPTPLDAPAGLLALASNSGSHDRAAFAVVPEVGANLGLRATERLTLFAGYSFLYWSEVARPGRQIDRTLNPALIPTSERFDAGANPRRPAFSFGGSDFWAHGLNVGFEFRY